MMRAIATDNQDDAILKLSEVLTLKTANILNESESKMITYDPRHNHVQLMIPNKFGLTFNVDLTPMIQEFSEQVLDSNPSVNIDIYESIEGNTSYDSMLDELERVFPITVELDMNVASGIRNSETISHDGYDQQSYSGYESVNEVIYTQPLEMVISKIQKVANVDIADELYQHIHQMVETAIEREQHSNRHHIS